MCSVCAAVHWKTDVILQHLCRAVGSENNTAEQNTNRTVLSADENRRLKA